MLKGWSKTQSLVALSSGESELYATLKAAAETLGLISMMRDLGWKVSGEIWGDASAALGIINRRGLGKTRHIDTGLLWVQQTAAERELKFNKVLGKVNPADLYTKYLDANTVERHTTALAYKFTQGRAKEAPKLHVLQSDDKDLCREVRNICEALNTNRSLTRRQKDHMVEGGCLCTIDFGRCCKFGGCARGINRGRRTNKYALVIRGRHDHDCSQGYPKLRRDAEEFEEPNALERNHYARQLQDHEDVEDQIRRLRNPAGGESKPCHCKEQLDSPARRQSEELYNICENFEEQRETPPLGSANVKAG